MKNLDEKSYIQIMDENKIKNKNVDRFRLELNLCPTFEI